MTQSICNTENFVDILRNEHEHLVAQRRAFPKCVLPLADLIRKTNAIEGALEVYATDQ